MRTFETGATRDSDDTKPDYEGYLSPSVLEAFGCYMTKHRVQADGGLRASDNWQRGIPRSAYMKSAWRHFLVWWREHRRPLPDVTVLEEALCALMFNVMGYLHELQQPHSTSLSPFQAGVLDAQTASPKSEEAAGVERRTCEYCHRLSTLHPLINGWRSCKFI